MHKKRITYIFLLIGLLGIFGTVWGTQNTLNSQPTQQPFTVPVTSALDNSTITYTKEVERVTQEFGVTVDLTGTVYKTITTIVNITFSYSNATQISYDLTEGASDVWSFSKYFGFQAPLGSQSFQVFIGNTTQEFDNSDDMDFEIINSPPRIRFDLSNTTITRNNTLYFNVTPTDAETPYTDLAWSWEILFGIGTIVPPTSGPEIINLSHFFLANTSDNRLGEYIIKGVISDNDGGSTTTYTPFTLENNVPIITDFNYTFPDILNPDRILRETEEFVLRVNVSDVEKLPANINLRVKLIDQLGNIYWRSNRMIRSSPWNFEGNISVEADYITGEYTCEIEAWELVESVDYNSSKSFTFTVGNNLPVGENISYTINNNVPTGSGIRINEFEDITFAVNVTDVDIEGIEFIKILLKSPDGDEFIYPFLNDEDNYIEYTISAKDLAYGRWVTWIYVVDFDGAEVHSLLSYPFDIIPDTFANYLPWIMFVIGAVIAFGVSMAVLGTRYINLKRNFDNLLSRSGDYKKPEVKTSKPKPPTPISSPSEKTESSEPTTPKKKNSPTKKHELFRKIKKK